MVGSVGVVTVGIAMALQSPSATVAATDRVDLEVMTLSLLIVAATILLNYFLGDLNRYLLRGVEFRSKYIMTDKKPRDYLGGSDKTEQTIRIMDDYFRFRFMLARFGFIVGPLIVTFIAIISLLTLLATAVYSVWPVGSYLVACLILPLIVYQYIFLLHGDVIGRRLAELTERQFENECFWIMKNELHQPAPISAYELLLYKAISRPLLKMCSGRKSTFFDAALHLLTLAIALSIVSLHFSTVALWVAISGITYGFLFLLFTWAYHVLLQRKRSRPQSNSNAEEKPNSQHRIN